MKTNHVNPYYFLEESFWWSPHLLLLFSITLFAIIFLRYFLLSAGFEWLAQRRAEERSPANKSQLRRELKWSLLSSAIFTLLTIVAFFLYQQGYTKVYSDIHEFGLSYLFGSTVLYLVLYETYYYWLHRWMHKPRIFRLVHRVHHESTDTSAFTSFSFHPLEAVLQFIFLPVMVLILPIHFYALGTILMLMTISAIVNHAGIEIYPQRFYKHPLGKWLIGSTHHDLHHREFRSNYGLYFTFWDKWMKTESKQYQNRFDQNKINRSQSQHRRSTDGQHK